MVNFNNDWDTLLQEEFQKDYYTTLRQFLISEYKTQKVYPNMHDIFNAMKATAHQDVKVVILGQDPYHQPGQAHGMAFSVKDGVTPPPSLCNIYKEISADLGLPVPTGGNLSNWAEQGVLLLNTVLTVRESRPQSHKNMGWETFTTKVIELLNSRDSGIVFLLWGRPAREKKVLITNPNHLVLEAAHPSPLSAHNGFFGCKHFSKTNDWLVAQNKEPINW